MGDHIVGMKKMREISATVKGANQHCTKVFKKSFGAQPTQKPKTGDPAPSTPTETSEMDVNITKSFAALMGRADPATSSQAFAYVGALEDDKVKSFFEQDAEAQDAEIKKHLDGEAEKAKTAAAAAAAAEAGNPEVELLKSEVATLREERKVEKAAARDRELREIAKTAYPAVPKAYDTLKSLEKLDETERAPMLAVLKSQQDLAKNLGTVIGNNDDDGATSAKVKYDNAVAERAKEKNITKAAARVEIAEDPDMRDLVREYREELRETAAA